MSTPAAIELYDVVIYEIATRKIDAVIGRNLKSWDGTGTRRGTAELRVQNGLDRINDRFGCIQVEAGKYQVGDTYHL